MVQEIKEPLLLHQFLAGLLGIITRKLRASGEIKTLAGAMAHAGLLINDD